MLIEAGLFVPVNDPGPLPVQLEKVKPDVGCRLNLASASGVIPSAGRLDRATRASVHGQEELFAEQRLIIRVGRGSDDVGDRAIVTPLLPHVANAGACGLR